MAVRTPRVPLTDIRDAIRRIERYTKGETAASFAKNELVRDAVERCIEIISEASRKIPADLKSRHPEIPWRKVAGVGNVGANLRIVMSSIMRRRNGLIA